MSIGSSIRQLFSHKKTTKNSITQTSSDPTRLKSPMDSTSQSESQMNTSSSFINSSSISASEIQFSLSSKEGHSFRYENGRRYHADQTVVYILPNDDDEVDRVHQQHWVLRYILQCNFNAPITEQLEKGIVCLDSGTGPGTWAFDMAEAYPNSKFCGIDISCIFPENIKPANVEFVIGNIARHIPYADNTFDYIHQRLLLWGLTEQDWSTTLMELYRVLKPGGYIELAEFDLQNIGNIGPCLQKLQDATKEMLVAHHLPTNVCGDMKNRLAAAGFEKHELKIVALPLNHNGKGGKLFWDDYKHAFANIKPVLAKINPEWQDQQVYAQFLKDCGIEARSIKASCKWYQCYAQKPLS